MMTNEIIEKMEEVVDGDHVMSWRELWEDFCDHSSLVGLRPLGQESPFTTRR